MGKRRDVAARSERKAPRYGWLAALVVIMVVGIVFAWRAQVPPPQLATDVPAVSSRAVVPAAPGRETRPILDPALFVGKPALAHQVAREIPEVLDQLYCYCECDKFLGHRSLLSCYVDGHAATGDICMDEALEASRMLQAGYQVAQIRAEIDGWYGK